MTSAQTGPQAVTLLDISTTGFSAILPEELPIGAPVAVEFGLPESHAASVAWSHGQRYGFLFLRPLGEDEVEEIRRDPAPRSAETAAGRGAPIPAGIEDGPRLPARRRLGAIVLLTFALWLALIAIVAIGMYGYRRIAG